MSYLSPNDGYECLELDLVLLEGDVVAALHVVVDGLVGEEQLGGAQLALVERLLDVLEVPVLVLVLLVLPEQFSDEDPVFFDLLVLDPKKSALDKESQKKKV